MSFSLDYDPTLGIYKLNNRPLTLTEFARLAYVEFKRMSERLDDLERGVFTVAEARPYGEGIDKIVESSGPAAQPEQREAEESIAIQDEASAMPPSPPGYKRKNKSKER